MRRAAGLALLALAVAGVSAAPASAGKLGSAGGFTYVKATKKADRDVFDTAVVTVRCPGGSTPVGGGQSISSDPDRSFIGGFYPFAGDRWGAELWNYEVRGKTTASAWAVCTKQEDRVRFGAGSTSTSSVGPKYNQTSCSEGSITGGGFSSSEQLNWYTNAVFPSNYPSPGGDPDALDALSVTTYHVLDQGETINRYAFCMTGGKPKYPTNKESGRTPVKAKVYCPKGSSVTSGGYVATKGDGQSMAHASESKPIDSKTDADGVPDDGWQVVMSDFEPKRLTVQATAFCR